MDVLADVEELVHVVAELFGVVDLRVFHIKNGL